MANVFDVAQYILANQGPMTTMKLQKLVYYCQAWSLAWDGEPLFTERIEAWASGPVVRELYNAHRGEFKISALPIGDIDKLSAEQRDTIDNVLSAYGPKSAQWLADLAHMEEPWQQARKGIEVGEYCENEITQASLQEYYCGLPSNCEPV